MKNDERWMSHKYYVSYMIMQSNMTMVYSIITERWKLHGNISRNGYGNAIIGRYGGYFEEDIRRLMCDRAYHITGFWMQRRSLHHIWTLERAMHGTEEASKLQKGESVYNPWTDICHKELTYLLQNFISHRNKVLIRILLGERLVGVNHRVAPTFTQR